MTARLAHPSLPQGVRSSRVLLADRWYVFLRMRLNRTLRFGFAMLLALMLPLQGYAAMPGCARHDHANSGAMGMTASAMGHPHCEHATPGNGHCDNGCCGVAIAATSVRWIAPLLAVPEISHVVLWFPPTVAPDRLDRPPRYLPA